MKQAYTRIEITTEEYVTLRGLLAGMREAFKHDAAHANALLDNELAKGYQRYSDEAERIRSLLETEAVSIWREE